MKLESSKEKYSSGNQEVNRKHSEGDKSSTHPTESVGSLRLTALDLGNNSAPVSSSSVHKKMFKLEDVAMGIWINEMKEGFDVNYEKTRYPPRYIIERYVGRERVFPSGLSPTDRVGRQ